ncbi:RnfABCDGE type electron transport complex subunit D [Buchnera aphidicola]|uniref:RnfABCDGE type electron transport complex subunit D n=1 Tax=Buchnera aphidicola TaxID=9 RepID=UPI0034649344
MNFPYIYPMYSIRKIMFFVLIACIPGICAKCYFFGLNVLVQIFFSIVISILFEIIILKMCHKNIKFYLYDNSVIVTAILFGVSLPSLLPWWIIFIGLFFSIIVAKHLYGGIGQNIFNPAMIGYAILLISFPLYMSNWKERDLSLSLIEDVKASYSVIFLKNSIYPEENNNPVLVSPELFSQATPLNDFKTHSHLNYNNFLHSTLEEYQIVNLKNSWKWININFLLGGIFLIYKKIICWRIPLSFLITLSFLSTITWLWNATLFSSPIIHFLSGGTMICAFFIATDPVTMPCTNTGRIIFSIITALLVWLLRNYSNYPDSIAFSVLFSNMLVPLIDYFIKPSVYGHKKI